MVNKQRFDFRPLALGIALASLPLTAAQAGIHSAIGGLFDGMSSTQPAGVYESQRRGVISGGGVRVRTPIREENLMNLRLPSADAGCGGIDLFGGSLSFVNAEELVALFRNIAQGAKGYAFSIALRTISPDILQTIEDMQQKVQALNALSINSCEWAQGLVDPAAEAFGRQFDLDIKGTGAGEGVFDSFFEGLASINDGANAEQSVQASAPTAYAEMTGNLVWNTLKSNNVDAWNWIGSSGNNDFLEAIMSLSGSYIVVPQPDPSAERDNVPLYPTIRLRDFVEGAENVSRYKCNEHSRCETPTIIEDENIQGLADMLRKTLLGGASNADEDSQDGLIYKYSDPFHPGGASEMEVNLITSLPYGAGGMIQNLAVLEPGTARLFVTHHANAMALDAAYSLATAMLDASLRTISTSQSTFSSQARDILVQSRTDLENDYVALLESYGSVRDLLPAYNGLIENARRQRYHLQNVTNNSRAGD